MEVGVGGGLREIVVVELLGDVVEVEAFCVWDFATGDDVLAINDGAGFGRGGVVEVFVKVVGGEA